MGSTQLNPTLLQPSPAPPLTASTRVTPSYCTTVVVTTFFQKLTAKKFAKPKTNCSKKISTKSCRQVTLVSNSPKFIRRGFVMNCLDAII